MRKISIVAVLFATGIIYFSCKKAITDSPPITKNTVIAEAKTAFNSTNVTQTLAKSGKKTREKTPLWGWARIHNTSLGKVVIVPLQYTRQEYVKSSYRDTGRLSLMGLASLYI